MFWQQTLGYIAALIKQKKKTNHMFHMLDILNEITHTWTHLYDKAFKAQDDPDINLPHLLFLSIKLPLSSFLSLSHHNIKVRLKKKEQYHIAKNMLIRHVAFSSYVVINTGIKVNFSYRTAHFRKKVKILIIKNILDDKSWCIKVWESTLLQLSSAFYTLLGFLIHDDIFCGKVKTNVVK